MGPLSLILLLLAFLSSASCYTPVKDPGRERSERKNTIGFSTGSGKGSALISYSKNFNQKFSLRSSFSHDWSPKSFTVDLATGTNLMGEAPNENSSRIFKEKNSGFSSAVLFFPLRSQFIFAGVQASVGRYQTAYTEFTSGFSADTATEDVEFIDNYIQIAAPIGLSINTEDKMNLFGSLNPTWQMGSRRSVLGRSQSKVSDDLLTDSLNAIDKNRRFRMNFEAGVGKNF